MAPIGAVTGAPACYRDRVARFHTDSSLPAGAVQDAWTIAFELPVGHSSFLVLDVEVEVAVGVGPLDFSHNAGEGDGLVGVVFGTKGMVRRERNRKQSDRGEQPPKLGLDHFGPELHFHRIFIEPDCGQYTPATSVGAPGPSLDDRRSERSCEQVGRLAR